VGAREIDCSSNAITADCAGADNHQQKQTKIAVSIVSTDPSFSYLLFEIHPASHERPRPRLKRKIHALAKKNQHGRTAKPALEHDSQPVGMENFVTEKNQLAHAVCLIHPPAST
jgi:hypothetical protein